MNSMDTSSVMSSPLTSLTSLDDVRESVSPLPPPHLFSFEDIAVAQVRLFRLLFSNFCSQNAH